MQVRAFGRYTPLCSVIENFGSNLVLEINHSNFFSAFGLPRSYPRIRAEICLAPVLLELKTLPCWQICPYTPPKPIFVKEFV